MLLHLVRPSQTQVALTERHLLPLVTGAARSFSTNIQSYEHMGKALFSCVSGCTCSNVTVDGHHKVPASVSAAVHVGITPARSCVVQSEVLEETSSGEHKFKVCSHSLVAATLGAAAESSRGVLL